MVRSRMMLSLAVELRPINGALNFLMMAMVPYKKFLTGIQISLVYTVLFSS